MLLASVMIGNAIGSPEDRQGIQDAGIQMGNSVCAWGDRGRHSPGRSSRTEQVRGWV